MYEGNRVAVVVPAYNEAGFVGEVIETVPSFVDRVYVVDDASTDGTWAEIRAHAHRQNLDADGVRVPEAVAAETDAARADATSSDRTAADALEVGSTPAGGAGTPVADADAEGTDPEVGGADGTEPSTDGGVGYGRRVVPVRHEENRGVGAGITTGYRLAAADDMDVFAVMNGDGQMDPDILDRILDPVVEGEADYAKGNRLGRPEYRDSMSRWRLFGNTVLTFLTKVASGYWGMMDPQNGYTAISAATVERLDLEETYDEYGFCNDLLVRLNVHRCRVADVDMPAVYGEENSHIRYSRFVPKLSWLLLKRFLWRLRSRYLVADFHPLVFLYVLGAVGLLAGTVYGAWALSGPGSRLVHAGIAATELLVAGTILVGAMVLDMLYNRDLEVTR